MNGKEKPNYFSILTAEVRYDENLSASEKICYSEITALTGKYGYCYATNGYFAKLYKVNNNTIRRWIKNLEKQGYISTELVYKNNSYEVEKRKIYITPPLKNDSTPLQKCREGSPQKCGEGHYKNVEENNININTINKNSIYSPAGQDGGNFNLKIKEIIDFLNDKCNKHFKVNTKNTIDIINKRLKEGFEVEDFKKVILKKSKQWKNTDYDKFLRPTTLFGDKFEGYLNENTSFKSTKSNKGEYRYEAKKIAEKMRQKRIERILNEAT